MANERILVVEDDDDILDLLIYNLEKNGYKVTGVGSGEDALKEIEKSLPDLVLLDLMLPGIDGLDICKLLKNNERTSDIPVVMLTAKGEEADIVIGLELGADDYIAKPFSLSILIARLRAALRRERKRPLGKSAVVNIGELVINPDKHEVTIKDDVIELTHTEFSVLHLLAGHPGRVFTRQQIIDNIRGYDSAVTERSVDVQVTSLRKKMGSRGMLIQTVHGVGYKFKEKDNA